MTIEDAREIFVKYQKYFSDERANAVKLTVSLMSDTVANTTTLILSGEGEGGSNVYINAPYIDPSEISFEPWSICKDNLPYRRDVHHYAGVDLLPLIDKKTATVRM